MKFLKFFLRLILEVAAVLMLDDWIFCYDAKGHHWVFCTVGKFLWLNQNGYQVSWLKNYDTLLKPLPFPISIKDCDWAVVT